jgi:glycosyltransferase involved in cell wall biosynthesis
VLLALSDGGEAGDTVSNRILPYLLKASEQLIQSEWYMFSVAGQEWEVAIAGRYRNLQNHVNPDSKKNSQFRIVLVTKPINADADGALPCLFDIAAADIVCLPDVSFVRPLLTVMRKLQVDRLLPEEVVFLTVDSLASPDLATRVLRISQQKNRLENRASDESLIERFGSRVADSIRTDGYQLAIVISTFNRAAFTELNVGWLVDLTKNLQTKVCVVVFDNASTDDTVARLQKYASVPNFILKVNAQNVGMLGNLHAVSTLCVAKHVWLTGDDDYIRRGAIERVLIILEAHPRVPLIAHNFSVYYRTMLSPEDSPERFEAESVALCPSPSPSGMRPIVDFVQEHDNLFTAIYPLVFRSDIAAACFNYPFDGVPFDDLVESIPTTKIILESLGMCVGYWLGEVGVTGNAHNSWSIHRPRWHLVIMPMVFYLTRTLRMNPDTVWKWLNVHLELFYESIQIAAKNKHPIILRQREIELAEWMFQKKIDIPDGLAVHAHMAPPLLHFSS